MEREEPPASQYLPREVLAGVGESSRRQGPAEVLNSGEPATPRQSASVILMRDDSRSDAGEGLEVLLLRRSGEASFMPDVWVFPGGTVDSRLDGTERHDSLKACAARELREEAGVELPADRELIPFARWITPEAIKTRFDAWFFLARSPAGIEARPDGGEAVEARWIAPKTALQAFEREEMTLVFPTISKLQALAGFSECDEAMRAFRGREVTPILPKPVTGDSGIRLALPGDPDYPA